MTDIHFAQHKQEFGKEKNILTDGEKILPRFFSLDGEKKIAKERHFVNRR